MSLRCCKCAFGVRRGVAFDYPVSEGPGPLVLRLSKYERGEGRKVVSTGRRCAADVRGLGP